MSMNIPPRNMSMTTCPIFITDMGMRSRERKKEERREKQKAKAISGFCWKS
jgi:hypothetical protein